MKTAKKRKLRITLFNLDNLLAKVGKEPFKNIEYNDIDLEFRPILDYEVGMFFKRGTTLTSLKVGDIGYFADIWCECKIAMKVIELAESEPNILVEIEVPKELEDCFRFYLNKQKQELESFLAL
ncbi:hypothetical protein [Campylobacter fetus]|uniref:hypothetical protein n=1 Tax=Campylobacter fetus TaxID=196 RepID=UPI00112F8547|nr:hypothetical protein [Campylobacter fetus]